MTLAILALAFLVGSLVMLSRIVRDASSPEVLVPDRCPKCYDPPQNLGGSVRDEPYYRDWRNQLRCRTCNAVVGEP